jgi:hypothetical protein
MPHVRLVGFQIEALPTGLADYFADI